MKNFLNMKTIFISLFALLSAFTAFAQFDGNKPQIDTYDQYWTFGFHYGIAQFKGDISSKSYFAKLKDESKPSFSFNIGRQISPVFALKAEFSMSSLYSRVDSILYLGDKSNLSMKGDVNEIGLYGIINLNNLFNKNRSTESKWNAYISSGIGYAFFRSRLRDEINNTIVDSVGYAAGGKTSRLKEIVFPVTVGINFQITDGIWLSLENSSRFVNSDRMDAYINGKTDWFNTTKIGLTFNIQKLGSIKSGRSQKATRSKASSSYIGPTYVPVASTKSQRRSIYKSSSKTPPEIIDYTGFNPMIPPPVIKNTVILNQNQSTTGNGNKDENRWVDPNNPGQFEITGVYNKKTAVDTLEVKKIKEGKFKGRTIRISRGFGPSGSSSYGTGVGAPISRSVNRSTRVVKVVPVNFEPGTIYKIQIQASKENIPAETMAKKMNIKIGRAHV